MSYKELVTCQCCGKELVTNEHSHGWPTGWFRVSVFRNEGVTRKSSEWQLICCPDCVPVEKDGVLGFIDRLKSFFKRLRLAE